MSEENTTPEENTASEGKFDINTVIDDAKKLITNPKQFYTDMPTTGGYVNPMIFLLVMAAIAGLITGVLGMMGLGMGAMPGSSAFAGIIIYPIAMLIGGFIAAGVMFIIWKLLGSEKSYETAYRCIAYSTAIAPVMAVISVIPYLGGIIHTLWGSFLMYIASTQVHAIKEQTAKVTFAILAAIGVIWGVSSERASRNMVAHFEKFEGIEDMTPEEAGEKLGEFLKGIEKGAEKAKKED